MKIVNNNELHLEDEKIVYVHVGGRVIYIDNSTGEMLVEMWRDDGGLPPVKSKMLHREEPA